MLYTWRMKTAPAISIVVPVHNEQDNVAELAHQLTKTLGPDDEIIFIDDGSTDATWKELEKLHRPGRVRLFKLRANFGKAAALMAGFARTRGDVVFTMDGDMQDDPAEIPRFIARLDEGFDLVSGWRKQRRDPRGKIIASRIFNACTSCLTRVNLHDMNCGFTLYRGELARRVRIYGELHRFIPVLAAWQGYRVDEIEVRHRTRLHGRSKYGSDRLCKGFFDLITVLLATRFADRPAHAFGFAAAGCASAALAAAAGWVAFPRVIPLGGLALFFALSAVVLLAAGGIAEIMLVNASGERAAPRFDVEETRE